MKLEIEAYRGVAPSSGSGHYSITPRVYYSELCAVHRFARIRLDDGWRRFMLPAFQLAIATVHDYCYGFEVRDASDRLKRH